MSVFVLETDYIPKANAAGIEPLQERDYKTNTTIEYWMKEKCVNCDLSRDVDGIETIYNHLNGTTIVRMKAANRKPGQNCGWKVKAHNISNGCEILMVGEAPGFNECEQGKPFVGISGKLLLDNMRKLAPEIPLSIIGWTNVVKCRPKNNAQPGAIPISECLQFLISDIEQAKPRVIVAVGGVSAKVLTNRLAREKTYTSMKAHHGRYMIPLTYKGARLITMMHPAAYLHMKSTNEAAGITYLARIKDDIIYMAETYRAAVQKNNRYKKEAALTW